MYQKKLILYFLLILSSFFIEYLSIPLIKSQKIVFVIIVGVSFLKTISFMINIIKKEIDFFKKDINSNNSFYILILLSVFLIITSYAFDYFLVYNFFQKCFNPLAVNVSIFKKMWLSFYYSSMIFFWMGIADVTSSCTISQMITWAESLVTFFILSYSGFKFLQHK
ncbi:MAG: hypothetical protein U0V72_05685 [Cytophagales bacterium]